jgi:hypothetical protein
LEFTTEKENKNRINFLDYNRKDEISGSHGGYVKMTVLWNVVPLVW